MVLTHATFEMYLKWEAETRDIIDFKKAYVDIADGDVIAGLALSEIMYWYLPSRNGKSKLRVWKGRHYWIAVHRHDWWDRTRMSPKQADRAIAHLVQLGIIEKSVHKFDGAPTVHVRIVEDKFLECWEKNLEEPLSNPFLPKGENPFSPNVEMNFPQTGKTLTEITTENTTEKDSGAYAPQAGASHFNQNENASSVQGFSLESDSTVDVEIPAVAQFLMQFGNYDPFTPKQIRKLQQELTWVDLDTEELQHRSVQDLYDTYPYAWRKWFQVQQIPYLQKKLSPGKNITRSNIIDVALNISHFRKWYIANRRYINEPHLTGLVEIVMSDGTVVQGFEGPPSYIEQLTGRKLPPLIQESTEDEDTYLDDELEEPDESASAQNGHITEDRLSPWELTESTPFREESELELFLKECEGFVSPFTSLEISQLNMEQWWHDPITNERSCISAKELFTLYKTEWSAWFQSEALPRLAESCIIRHSMVPIAIRFDLFGQWYSNGVNNEEPEEMESPKKTARIVPRHELLAPIME